MGGSKSKSTSAPIFREFPGAFGAGTPEGPSPLYSKGAELAGSLQTLLQSSSGALPSVGGIGGIPGFNVPSRTGGQSAVAGVSPARQSPYTNPLQQALLSPEFGPTTSSEQALLSSIADFTAGRGAVRGLGAPTQSGLAQAIAPTLVGLRNQNIQNLMGARQQDIGQLLASREQDITQRGQTLSGLLTGRGQDITQRGQEISGGLTARGQDISRTLTGRGQDIAQRQQDLSQQLGLRQQDIAGLLELISLAMPQLMGGTQSTSRSGGIKIL